MADDEELSDAELADEEQPPEQIGTDYEELDHDTGFRAVDWKIWQAYEEAVLNKPEDDREEPEEWAETFATENNLDLKRITAAIKVGIYAGGRDEFNQRSGEGKTIYANGDTYEGQYWEGRKSGFGKYVYKSAGMSEVDKLVVEMLKVKPTEESYEQFAVRAADHLRVGRDVVRLMLEMGPHPCYYGGFINNQKEGKGVMKNKDGSIYKGDFVANKRHGEGVFTYLNGDVYSGQWVEGKKHGGGCYTFAGSKGQYIGVWDKGTMQEGQWIMSDGNLYEGKFDYKNRPGDPNGAIKFPKLGLVQQGNYQKGKWRPTDKLVTEAEYAAAREAGQEDVEEAQPAAEPVVA
eukprot:NODE_1781_length_1409_cov_102.151471_g1610_i0.p1 GENE.NODE_1781_length_1409_cov_102.151471_g1610_i0~~NODE_1781_length_1409_cov_102.151471_g1610_i0.p1  ORF type:complete len:347 (-),score=80.90 NODE_1781_length_1409_cov_102.151471_g1610_i0:267-1307(-)